MTMTAIRYSNLAVALVFGFGLWVGCAAADESSSEESAAGVTNIETVNVDTLNIDNGAIGNSQLQTVNSGQGAAMSAVSSADADLEENDITNSDGSTFQTGAATGMMANSGGINVNMVNSGNNVAMQANTTINLYLGGSAGAE